MPASSSPDTLAGGCCEVSSLLLFYRCLYIVQAPQETEGAAAAATEAVAAVENTAQVEPAEPEQATFSGRTEDGTPAQPKRVRHLPSLCGHPSSPTTLSKLQCVQVY